MVKVEARYALASVISPPLYSLSLDRDLVFGQKLYFFTAEAYSLSLDRENWDSHHVIRCNI